MNKELYHYGISGMKWHRRRFQNPDGSLTPAGRERYLKNAERADAYRQKAADASLKSAKYAYKRDKIAGRRVQTDLSIGKANRMAANSSRANVRAARYERKAQRLEKANRDLNNPVDWSEKQYRRYLKKEARRVSKTDDNSSDRERFNKYASDFIDKYGSESYLKALSGGAIVNAGRNALKSMGGSLYAPANEMLFKAFVDKGRADTELEAKRIIKENGSNVYGKLHNLGYSPSEIAKLTGESAKDTGKPSGLFKTYSSKYKLNKNDMAHFRGMQNRARSLKASGKTIDEIADMMGEPVSWVKDYLYEDFS